MADFPIASEIFKLAALRINVFQKNKGRNIYADMHRCNHNFSNFCKIFIKL